MRDPDYWAKLTKAASYFRELLADDPSAVQLCDEALWDAEMAEANDEH